MNFLNFSDFKICRKNEPLDQHLLMGGFFCAVFVCLFCTLHLLNSVHKLSELYLEI